MFIDGHFEKKLINNFHKRKQIALIHTDQFNNVDKIRNAIHKPTIATFTVFEDNGQKYFQIDTYGTAERVMTGKVSQSIQLGKSMAEMFIDILQREFSLD